MFKKVYSFFILIKFEHTIFGLPFAYMGGMISYKGIMPFYYWLWITLAGVSARTFAMLLNRIIDKEIDRKNPRTKNRPFITGKIKIKETIPILILSIFLFFFSCFKLNLTSLFLSPIALFLISSYPYTKRFTWASHFYLGLCLSCAPIGGFLAVSGRLDISALILGLFVILWVSGFDIIYSLLDMEFDKEYNLYSIPQRFGEERALQISFFLHILSGFLLIPFGILSSFGLKYWMGAFFIFLLLIRQHIIIRDRKRINEAFFTTNGIISILLFFIVLSSY
ncbi:MAG: 4-hydroxybenzoate octaprenyltransferase [bacterium]